MLSVNGYMSYRKSTLLDLAADNLISQVNEMRSWAIHGKVDGERYDEIKAALSNQPKESVTSPEGASKCFGLYFKDGEIGSFSTSFENSKLWDHDLGWIYAGCGHFDQNFKRPLEIDDQITIVSVKADGADVQDFEMQFAPPDGELESDASELAVTIQYLEDENFRREIIFNLTDGNAKVEKI